VDSRWVEHADHALDPGDRVIEALASLLENGSQSGGHLRSGSTFAATVEPARLVQLTDQFARTHEARLADLFATERPGQTTIALRVVYAFDREDRYVVLQCPIDGSVFPSLSDLDPAGFLEECEIYEQFGIRPGNDKPLNRVHMAPNVQDTFTRLRPREPEFVGDHAPHVIEGEAIEFPFGPVRAAGWESLYMGLVTTGEEVLDLYLFHWHKHRATERRMAGATLEQALFWAERVEGLCAVANAIAFCQAAETAAGIPVCGHGARVRCVALELERIYNHTAAIAMMCQSTGLSVGQANVEIVLERLLRCNAAAFGHRYLFGVVCPGGMRRGPDIAALREQLPGACSELRRVTGALMRTNSFVDRLEATGIVTGEDARRLGLVGPVARASGMTADVRADHPSFPYDELTVDVASATTGDALARMQVMCEEIEQSRRLVLSHLGLLEQDAGSDTAAPWDADSIKGQDGLGWAESARGEALAWLAFDEHGRIARARLRPASARNWRAFDEAARAGNVFTDIPIIEASFWLTVAGVAR
jgi:Ni,Fe-hydrogenase III large subunit/Ni,Fe-hydrogenase III component G